MLLKASLRAFEPYSMLTTEDPLGGFSRSDWSANETLPRVNLYTQGNEICLIPGRQVKQLLEMGMGKLLTGQWWNCSRN